MSRKLTLTTLLSTLLLASCVSTKPTYPTIIKLDPVVQQEPIDVSYTEVIGNPVIEEILRESAAYVMNKHEAKEITYFLLQDKIGIKTVQEKSYFTYQGQVNATKIIKEGILSYLGNYTIIDTDNSETLNDGDAILVDGIWTAEKEGMQRINRERYAIYISFGKMYNKPGLAIKAFNP